jgi:transcriptional regulator with XRE-family HTH domain
MSALSSLCERLSRSKRYRESFAASAAKRILQLQIRVLRKQREWSQLDLAKESGLTQGVISRAEDPDYGNLSVNTLIRIASGFDCAFIGRFVPFSELGRWYTSLDSERSLRVAAFADDVGWIDRKEPQLECYQPASGLTANISQGVASAMHAPVFPSCVSGANAPTFASGARTPLLIQQATGGSARQPLLNNNILPIGGKSYGTADTIARVTG